MCVNHTLIPSKPIHTSLTNALHTYIHTTHIQTHYIHTGTDSWSLDSGSGQLMNDHAGCVTRKVSVPVISYLILYHYQLDRLLTHPPTDLSSNSLIYPLIYIHTHKYALTHSSPAIYTQIYTYTYTHTGEDVLKGGGRCESVQVSVYMYM